MINIFKNYRHLIFSFLFLLSVFPLLVDFTKKESFDKRNKVELFNSELVRLNSVQKISDYVDSIYYETSKSKIIDTSLYVKISSEIIKKRFYHGLSYYSFYDNWIASLSGKFLWSHLSAIVKPSDILKHAEGLCSQQTIVFLEILKRKDIHFRTIGLGYKKGPGHFLCEVRFNNEWHLHDVTIEPKWDKIANHHKSMEYYRNNKDSLFFAYDGLLDRKLFDKIMGKVEYGKVDETPAIKMLMFHQITFVLTYLIPLALLAFILITLFKTKAV